MASERQSRACTTSIASSAPRTQTSDTSDSPKTSVSACTITTVVAIPPRHRLGRGDLRDTSLRRPSHRARFRTLPEIRVRPRLSEKTIVVTIRFRSRGHLHSLLRVGKAIGGVEDQLDSLRVEDAHFEFAAGGIGRGRSSFDATLGSVLAHSAAFKIDGLPTFQLA